MTQEHPITPPPELVEQWHKQLWGDPCPVEDAVMAVTYIACTAARWGADQELEACCQEVQDWYGNGSRLHTARRPKPPSLKEQALAELDLLKADATTHGLGFDAPAIRRALEQLND